jgi:hypothetical protein
MIHTFYSADEFILLKNDKVEKKKVKVSCYMPCRHMGGEEV